MPSCINYWMVHKFEWVKIRCMAMGWMGWADGTAMTATSSLVKYISTNYYYYLVDQPKSSDAAQWLASFERINFLFTVT